MDRGHPLAGATWTEKDYNDLSEMLVSVKKQVVGDKMRTSLP